MCFLDFFGISFWHALVASVIGAGLGIAGAFTIYTVSVNRIRKDRLKYIVSLLDSIVPWAKRSEEYCQEAAKKFKADPLNTSYLKIEANRDIKRLADKVEQEGVFHAFLYKYSRSKDTYTKFREIYGYIDYLDFLADDLISFHEKTILGIWERKKSYANSFRQIKEHIQAIIIDQNIKASHPEYVEFLNTSLESYFDKNPAGENIVYSHTSLTIPVRDYLLKNGPVISQNTELMFLLNEAINHYRGIEMAGEYASGNYEEYGKLLKDKADLLTKGTEQLRKDFAL